MVGCGGHAEGVMGKYLLMEGKLDEIGKVIGR